jgi:pyruvate/2-oxoglutarate/acetoin dehydrogenase E1 component
MKFYEAVRDATFQALENDPRVFLIGVGIIDPQAVWGTLAGALARFGPSRVVEGPLAENALTGIAIGAATLGMRPVLIHHRIDFTLLTMDQLINHAAKWAPMFGWQQRVPMVIRGVVGRGWGNGPQHTSTHHALFAHVPGLKAVVPSNAYDAKGLLLGAIEDEDPVVYIEHRWLHEDEGDVPEGYYTVPLGKARVARAGSDVTVVAIGPMVSEALKAAAALAADGIAAEVIDLRTIFPIDTETVVESVAKTGRLVVADADWASCGVAGEVIAQVSEQAWDCLRAAPARITWPELPVPSSYGIERQFYPGAQQIHDAALRVAESTRRGSTVVGTTKEFHGPF